MNVKNNKLEINACLDEIEAAQEHLENNKASKGMFSLFKFTTIVGKGSL